ncbi:MAG: ribonuclease HII [Alphaproteobacteria bacterium]
MPDFRFESEIAGPVAGLDEAGRGPWAGPVVAAAVILDARRLPAILRDGLDDSKALSAETRAALDHALRHAAREGVARLALGAASATEIDALNILQATFLAMRRALSALGSPPALALIDGNRAPVLPCPVRTIIGGDGLSLSIAAASILAKVARDRLMARLGRRYPEYGWGRNAGYGTPGHRAALAAHGPTPHHRMSFAPLAPWRDLAPNPESRAH